MSQPFVHRVVVESPYEEVLARVPEALKAEGFGVLTEIDVRATLAKKLEVPFRPYMILGACRPPSAHAVLQRDLSVGALLPCNVVVYSEDETGESGKTVVEAIDPVQTISSLSEDPEIGEVAQDVDERLRRVLASLGSSA